MPPAKTMVSKPPRVERQGTKILFGLVAEQLDGVGGARIGGAHGKKIAHVRTGFRDAEQSALLGDELVHIIG